MQKVFLLGLGVTATLVAAVFIGAAAATTGAPILYDARHPVAVTTDPEAYDVDAGEQEPGAPADDAEQAVADRTAPSDRPGASAAPTTPAAPPSSAPPATSEPDDEAYDIDSDPGVSPPTAAERRRWLAFQQVVRDCMADAGQEYLYWEWWNPGADDSNRFPAMPADLTPDELAAWELALNGNAGTGEDSRRQDAGCWGRAVQITGGKR